MSSNKVCFNQGFFLITLIIVVLFLIYFIFTNRNAQIVMREGFQQQESNTNQYIASSPPILVNARDVPQLYTVQNIKPFNNFSEYDVGTFPNVVLNPFVVGCGGRREPCYGGSQQVVNNILPPLDISNNNIAPNNIKFDQRNSDNQLMEVGSIYKVFGKENIEYPLFVKVMDNPKRSNRYKYFTKLEDQRLRSVKTKSPYRELGINDQVSVEGEPYFYRVTIYQSNYPSYPNVQ